MTEVVSLSWIKESPQVQSQATPIQNPHPGYRSRKSHTKSRNGCHNCRKRRIKCDESKPSCEQCSDRLLGSLQCDYPVAQKPSAELSFPLPAHTVRSEIDNASARDKIVSSLKYSGVCGHFEDPIYRPGDALDLLNHFLETDDPWMGSPSFQQIVQRYGLGFSLKAPYLMHAILAFSACHLDYLYPHEKKYSIAFTLHYSLSLSSYSRQLRKSSDPSNADATIASSYLHTMMAFRNVQSPDHIKFSADSGGLPWLRAMRGVTIMWETSDLHVNLRGSVLLELQRYGHCSRDRSRDVISSMALEIPTEFHKLYEVDCDPDTFKNSYEKPLLLFSELMRVGTSRETICKFMAFAGELPNSFVRLLDERDPRALLILCYWSALLSQLDFWWVIESAHTVCRELCAYLDKVPDQRVRNLLQFPASKCDYVWEDTSKNTAEALLLLQFGRTTL